MQTAHAIPVRTTANARTATTTPGGKNADAGKKGAEKR
jgi:hypothetical protein